MKVKQSLIVIAGIYGLSSVALGAFGAHLLKAPLTERGMLTTWQTAVDYQMWHALALLIIASWSPSGRLARASGLAMAGGILLFSGSLYWLAMGGPSWLGPITPLGGLSLMVGWILLILNSCLRS